MAGTTETTIQKCTAHSTKGFHVQWRALTTALGHHLNVNNADASKVVLLVAHESSTPVQNYIWIGTSDSASSGGKNPALNYPYTAGKLGPLKVGSSKTLKGTAFTVFRSTKTTVAKVMAISVIGPFETARFKDSDGYINIAKGKLGSTIAFVGAILI